MSNEVKLEKELNIQNNFSPVSYEEWRQAVEKDLKGVPFEKKLVTKTYEEINLKPIYTKNDIKDLPQITSYPGYKNYLRGNTCSGYVNKGWKICQEIPYADAEEFNQALKYDLSRGQNCIYLLLDKATKLGLDADYAKVGEVGDGGLSISGFNSFSRTLKGIDLTKYPIYIECGFSSLQIITILNAYLKKEKINFKKIKGSVQADPLAYLITEGRLPVSVDFAFDKLAVVTKWAKKNLSYINTIGVSGLPYHNAGASAVQELAFVIASAVEYINQLLDRGLTINAIAQRICFTFGIGSFYFMEIAKLRAARILWSKIVESYGGNEESQVMSIHARTSLYNQTVFDPYVNLLRTTTEAFSAIVGGIDALTTNPFDEAIELPDEFSRRVARNTQIILNEESHLSSLIDPAGGSYYIEKLTDEVAKAAWSLFQQMQSKGGMLNALKEGFPQDEIAKVADKKKKDAAKRKSKIVGTNAYANIKEEKLQPALVDYKSIFKKRAEYLQKFRTSGSNESNEIVLEKLGELVDSVDSEIIEIGTDAILNGATLGEIAKATRAKTEESISVKLLNTIRISEMFEELRDASLSYEKKTGSKPKIFLVTMGSLSQYKARADFSKGFFEVGGFEVIYPKGFENTDAAVKAAIESKAKVVVICSTDDTYPALVPPIVKGIKGKDKNIKIVLAGYPKNQIEQHKQNGVDEFIFLGANSYEILKRILNF
jgi:methylmalonyl-CoA mutase